MGLLDNLIQGGPKRQEYEDFVNRYDQGPPHEGYDEDEAMRRHDEVAQEVSSEDYELSAREAFSRLSPEERVGFGRLLRQQARERGTVGDAFGDDDDDERFRDPDSVARVTSRLHREQPNVLGQLLGGGGGGGLGGALGNPVAKAAVAGIAAMAAKRMFGR